MYRQQTDTQTDSGFRVIYIIMYRQQRDKGFAGSILLLGGFRRDICVVS